MWIVLVGGLISIRYAVDDGGSGDTANYYTTNVLVPVGGNVSWQHVIMTHDPTIRGIDGIKPYFNNVVGTPIHATLFRGNTANIISANFRSTVNPMIAAENVGTLGSTNEYCGLIDNVCIWNKALNSVERSYLYNDGDGREDLYREFPSLALSTGPKIEGFTDEYSDEAVVVVNSATGYPYVNEEFIFDPRNFSHVLRDVSQADKLTVETFYRTNKAVSFYWRNEQEDELYEVVFMSKPYCQLDGANDRWKILLNLRQAGE